MTYKRFKEIKRIIRTNYGFSTAKLNSLGISQQEFDLVCGCPRSELALKYEKRMSGRPIKLFILSVVLFITMPIWLGVPLALIENYYQTKAIESLTGKKLDYWDVWWGGRIIRANAELQSKEK